MLFSFVLLALLPAAPAPPATVLSGHLTHAPAGDTVRVTFGARRYKTVLGAGGDFKLIIPDLPAPTAADFFYARQHASLYLAPGDQLHLTLDFPNFDETLAYTGRGAGPNNYLARARWQFSYGPAADSLSATARLTPATTPTQMRQLADAARQRRLRFLADYDQATPLPPAFRRDEEFGIALEWGTALLDYVGYHRAQAGSAPVPVPAAYFDFIKQLPVAEIPQYDGRSQTDNDHIGRLLTSYQQRLVPSGTLGTDPATARQLYAVAAADLGSPQLRDRAIFTLFSWKLDDDLPGVLAAYPTFRALNQDSSFARNLHAILSKRVLLGVGKPAPAFTLLDNTGRKVSLSDLRGKIVYLDFWGTWCPPCLREMPFAHDLKQQFLGRDVVFVYISVGDMEAKWQRALLDKKLLSPNSVHLRQPKEAQVAFDYQVNGYPTYWLIGRDGRILDMQAPRPSDGAKTVAALEAALQQ
ncbi:MAG: TlpA family protein disulfide reductase [Janthinobacterium lividum]